MKILNQLIACLLLLMVVGCQKPKFHIDGHITGMKNGSYVMLFKFKGDTIFSADTTTIQNNHFIFEGPEFLDDVSILTAGNYPDKVKATEVVLDKGNIIVNLDSVPLVTGSAMNDNYNWFKKKYADYSAKIATAIKNGADPEKYPTDSKLQVLYDSIRDYKLFFILDNIKNPVGLRLFKNDIIHNNIDDSMFQVILSQIPQKFLSDRLIVESIEDKRISLEKNAQRLTLAGKKYIDFDLLTPENKAVKLSDYMGHSKFTVIEFWASWCAPCIAEVPKLNEVYSKYKDKGLKIISISLDTRMNDWQRVIKEVNAPWIHLSDLKGTPSALTEAYGVLGVPHSLLIDENGIITAVKVNGQVLEMILEQALGDVKK